MICATEHSVVVQLTHDLQPTPNTLTVMSAFLLSKDAAYTSHSWPVTSASRRIYCVCMYVRQLPGLANRTSAAEIVAASACIASGLPRRYFD